MSPDFVEDHRGSHGSIQGFDTGSGNADQVCSGTPVGADSMGFAADDDGASGWPGCFIDRLACVSFGGVDWNSFELFANQVIGESRKKWQAEQGSRRTAQAFGVEGADGSFQEYDSARAEGFGCAHDGASVTGILNAVE